MSNEMKRYYLDIETGPLPADELQRVMPEFEPPGNLKDPEKIAVAIQAKRQAWIDNAALSAKTGQILAIGCAWDDDPPLMLYADERTMLHNCIHDLKMAIGMNAEVWTWNGYGFDFPFICQRAAVHGVPIYALLTSQFHGRYFWQDCLRDAMQLWAGPYNRTEGCGLDAIARTLKAGEKAGSGADFARLLKDDFASAKAYCLNDVGLLRSIVKRMIG